MTTGWVHSITVRQPYNRPLSHWLDFQSGYRNNFRKMSRIQCIRRPYRSEQLNKAAETNISDTKLINEYLNNTNKSHYIIQQSSYLNQNAPIPSVSRAHPLCIPSLAA